MTLEQPKRDVCLQIGV